MIASRDTEALRTVRLIRLTLISFIYGVLTFIILPVAVYTLPDIEAAWAPPLRDQRVYDTHYRPDDPYYLLWLWDYRKARKAVPEYITFMAYRLSDPRVRYAVDTYVGWDCKNVFRSDRTAEPSDKLITRQVCARLPEALAGKPDVRIDGVFDFNVGHGLYTVPVKIPPEGATIEARSIPAPLAVPK